MSETLNAEGTPAVAGAARCSVRSSKRKYRIVTDNYNGFEVQVWRWWWPFWEQVGICNTHSTVEDAKKWLASRLVRGEKAKTFKSKVVENL